MKSIDEILEFIKNCPHYKLFAIDLFCGAGGETEGIEQAIVNGQKAAKVIICINHDTNAILSHNENHKDCLHFIEDIKTFDLTPAILIIQAVRKYHPDAFILLHASLECTNFSKAKGGLPRDADSRTLAEHLFRYIEALKPEFIQIENVEEFMSWGDLDENGKPISKDKGSKYLEWVENVKQYGYHFDHRILNSADFGAYTSRRRFFGMFARHGLPIVFPEPTHAKNPQNSLFGALKKWNAVRDCLDFSDEGVSIFDRSKDLVEASLDRVLSGCVKFVAGGKEKYQHRQASFLVKHYSGHPDSKSYDVDQPAHTITAIDHHSLVSTRFIAKYYSGKPDGKVYGIDEPAHTIRTKDGQAVVTADFLSAYYGNGFNSAVDSPAPTVTTKDRFQLVRPVFMVNNYSGGGQHSPIDGPCPALTSVPKQNLVKCHFVDQQFGQSKPAGINQPCGALTANPKYNLVTSNQWVMNTNFGNVGNSVNDPAPVITANRKWHYLMNPQFNSQGGDINAPCFTLIARMDKRPPSLVEVTADTDKIPSFIKIEGNTVIYEIYDTDSPKTKEIKEFMALYGLLDIKMRMLRIPELKMIMGLPKDYILIGTQADQKKFIGNAVEVNTARAMAEATVTKLYELNLTPLSFAA